VELAGAGLRRTPNRPNAYVVQAAIARLPSPFSRPGRVWARGLAAVSCLTGAAGRLCPHPRRVGRVDVREHL